LDAMRKLFPEAFSFELTPAPTKRNTVSYESKLHDTKIISKF